MMFDLLQVYQWGGGKFTPQKQDVFVKGKSAIQVNIPHRNRTYLSRAKVQYR
jgi:hypothetical protein